MGLNLEIQVRGDKETIRRLTAAGESIHRLPDAMRETGVYLRGFFAGEVFASHGGVIGLPWPRLSARYEAAKTRKFGAQPPLVRTGLMQRSFRSSFSDNSARVFNTADYFKYHQSTLPRTKIPRRAMMDIDDTRARVIGGIVRKDVDRKLAAL